jgi:hypothetical protein
MPAPRAAALVALLQRSCAWLAAQACCRLAPIMAPIMALIMAAIMAPIMAPLAG